MIGLISLEKVTKRDLLENNLEWIKNHSLQVKEARRKIINFPICQIMKKFHKGSKCDFVYLEMGV